MRARAKKVELGLVVQAFLVFTMRLYFRWMDCYAQESGNMDDTTTTSRTPLSTTTMRSTSRTTLSTTTMSTTTITTPVSISTSSKTSASSLNTTSTTPASITESVTPPPPTLGVEPDPSPYPCIVSIAVAEIDSEPGEFTHLAGAVILNPSSVVSSCHILNQTKYLEYQVHFMMIVAGTSRIGWGMSNHTQMREVKGIFPHRECKNHRSEEGNRGMETRYNVALVTLKHPLIFNRHVKPMKLINNQSKTLNSFLTEYIDRKVPCHKTKFTYVNTRNVWNNTATEYEDAMTRDISENISRWSMTMNLATAPARLTSTAECRSSFCMLSSIGCKHDYTVHKQVCSYKMKILRNRVKQITHGNPIICDGYVFGLWTFMLEEFRCSPDVYSHPDCILSLMSDNGVEIPKLKSFYANEASNIRPFIWMTYLHVTTLLVRIVHITGARFSYLQEYGVVE